MDTFMDKIAQKANAQEIIAANMAADTAGLSQMQEQNSAYEEILQGMKASAEKNAETADTLSKSAELVLQNAAKSVQGAGAIEKNAQRLEGMIAAALAKIGEIQAGNQNTEELQAMLEEIKKVQAGQSAEISEFVHKENVKVYRNVQAVILEETAKQAESESKLLAAVKKKVGTVFAVSLIAMLAAVAGLALQILLYLQII